MHGVPGAFDARVWAPHLATRFTPCSWSRRPCASVMNFPPGARTYEIAPAAGAATSRTARAARSGLTGLLRVELLDLFRVLLVDRLALELHRRSELVAAG